MTSVEMPISRDEVGLQPGQAVLRQSANILLVDDEIGTLDTLTGILEDEGNRVVGCQYGLEALNHLMANPVDSPIDLVISDLRLPDIDGLEILKVQKELNPDADFILITAYPSVETAIRAVNQGVFAYHVKPLDINALKTSVRNAIKQRRLLIENRNLVAKVQQSNKELEAKNRELEQASLTKTQILSTVSHELKTPLTSIIGYSERLLLRREMVGPLNDRQQRYLETVWKNCRRLKVMIDDLLDASRIESGSLKLTFTENGVQQEIQDIVHSMRDQIDQRQVQVVLDIPPDLKVWADRLRFSQVVGNLLSNALKYSPSGANLTITAQEKAGFIQIDVLDTGIGISKADQSRLFTKFFRADGSMTRGVDGTGLGLFITKYLVRAQGGEIWAESEEGKGSTFSFTVPTVDADVIGTGTSMETDLAVNR